MLGTTADSGCARVVSVMWRARFDVGLDPADRDHGQPDVTTLLQQAVQRGLVGDAPCEQGVAVTGGERHPLEAGCISRVEAPLEADLVPAGLFRAARARRPG